MTTLPERQPVLWPAVLGVVAVALALFAVRAFGPSDLLDNDQQKVAAYILDAAVNGHWLVQVDDTGDITSKPPMYTWLAASAVTVTGMKAEWVIALPALLATALMAAVAVLWAGSIASIRAGLLAGLACLLTPLGAKSVFLVRTDPLFAATVFLACWLLWRALTGRSGWLPFWLAATAATLTKGPLGIALAAGGALALLWEHRHPGQGERPAAAPQALSGNLLGAGLLVLLSGGWFLFSWLELGQPVIDKMLGRELVGHAVRSAGGDLPGSGFYKPTLYFIGRAAPFSLLALWALWQVFRSPAADADRRFAERFLAAGFVAGLLLFSLAPHQRGDHLMPLVPKAMVLGAIGVEGFLRRLKPDTFAALCVGVSILGVAAVGIGKWVESGQNTAMIRSADARDFVAELRRRGYDGLPLEFADSVPYGVQFHLGVMRRQVAPEAIPGRLEAGVALIERVRDDPPPAPVPPNVAQWHWKGRSLGFRLLAAEASMLFPPDPPAAKAN